jgi:type III secretory pathway lipoprotein EscJ
VKPTPFDTPTSTEIRGGWRGRPAPAQVIALGLVAAAFVAAFWLLDERPHAEQVELLAGTVLPSSELAMVEAALDRAQLTDHRADGGRVWVPRQRHAAYMRALVDAEALPREFGSSLRRAIENDSPWRSRAAQEERLRVAIQDELAHVIRSMPGIEQAAVLFDAGDRPSFPQAGIHRAATASVNVRTHVDEPLEPSRVQAIRVLVAASIAGLEAERVAVTDLRSGRVHAGPLDHDAPEHAADPDFARRAALERHLATKIRQALSFVSGAVVDVTLSAGDEPAAASAGGPAPGPALPRQQQRVADANAPAEIDTGEQPVAVPSVLPSPSPSGPRITVTVAVPEPALRAAFGAASGRGEGPARAHPPETARDRLADHVRHLLPPPAHPDDHRIIVTAYAMPAAAAPLASGAGAAGSSSPQSLGGLIDDTLAAARAGRLDAVPRQAWLLLGAKVVAIVLWFVLRDGPTERGRRRERPRRRAASRIDWDTLEAEGAAGDASVSLADLDDAAPPRGVAA